MRTALPCACSPAAPEAWEKHPATPAAAAKLHAKSFTLESGAVVCGPDGVSVFDALHRRHKASDAILYAFDLLDLDGADLHPMLARSNSG
jgi:ATP-dependent DNA ligase